MITSSSHGCKESHQVFPIGKKNQQHWISTSDELIWLPQVKRGDNAKIGNNHFPGDPRVGGVKYEYCLMCIEWAGNIVEHG